MHFVSVVLLKSFYCHHEGNTLPPINRVLVFQMKYDKKCPTLTCSLINKVLLIFICFCHKEGKGKTGTGFALDCGAGIGRITKRLLLPLFRTVDLVDVTQDFLDQAHMYLGEEGKRVENYFCCGLQDFNPQPERYDIIWIQWVIGKAFYLESVP